MADEITVQSGLAVKKNNLNHRSQSTTFRDDMSGAGGPTPGSIVVSTAGTEVDLSQLADPGWCRITNQEDAGGSDIDLGIYDPELGRFWPIWRVHPGHSITGKLSPQFGWQEYSLLGTGTGTGTGGSTTVLMLRAVAHASYALVEAFDR